MIVLFTIILLLLPASAQAANALQTRIDATAPGTFSTNFNTSAGYNRNGISGQIWVPSITNDSSINEFATRMAFDLVRQEIRFLGQAHGTTYGGAFIKYDIATDAWSELAWPSAFMCQQLSGCGFTPANHEWDHGNAVRPSDGLHLTWAQSGDRALAYTPATNAWAQVGGVPGPNTVHSVSASSFAYFPNMAKFVYCAGDYGCWTLDPAHSGFLGNNVAAWTYIACGTICWSGNPGQAFKDSDGGSANTIMTYDAVRGRLYVATGNVGFGYFNASGVWTKLQNCPTQCELNSSSMAADPVTGDVVLMSQGTGTTRLYAFNGTNWSGALPVSIPSQFNAVGGALSVPSVTLGAPYNVIMFGVWTGTSNNGIFLYKHSAAAADTTRPSTPTGLVATAISSSQINLSGNAATDNVGVTGYPLERCTGAGCVNFVQIASPSTPSYSDTTGLSPSTVYRYRWLAVDAAGNTSIAYSNIATATTQAAPVGGTDFATRCAAAGVLRCFNFDTNAQLGSVANTDADFGIFVNGQSTCYANLPADNCPVIDTSLSSTGAGSLKFTIPSNSGAGGAGQWYANFSSDYSQLFGEGQEFWVQWRQRFDDAYIDNVYTLGDGEGAKVADLGAGNLPGCGAGIPANCRYSNEDIQVIIQDLQQRGYPQMYGYAERSGQPQNFTQLTEDSGGLLLFQNARPSPFCSYQQTIAGNQFPPNGNCFAYFRNEWMTFKAHVRVGTVSGQYWANTHVDLWMGRAGQALEPVIAWVGNYGHSSNKFGKLWLFPYISGKNSSQVHPVAHTWYDDVIISTQNIADPGSSPATPTSLVVAPLMFQ